MGSDKVENKKKRSLAVIAWNGVDQPFPEISFDAIPEFSILLFNYSGNDRVPSSNNSYQYDHIISKRTEFKGHLLSELYLQLKDNVDYRYIGIIDDDIQLKISAINQLISIAEANQLDSFQPSLSQDSHHSFEFNLHQPGQDLALVPWVEIMCPFYRKELFDACYPLCQDNISSYGIDKYVIPFYQQLLDMKRTAVIHTVQMKHLKAVTDGDKRFSNGLTARQEGERLRKTIRKMVTAEHAGKFTPEQVESYYGDHISFLNKLKTPIRIFMKDMGIHKNKR